MKKNHFLFALILLISFNESYSRWTWQNPSLQGNPLTKIKFINPATGWAVGNYGTILQTIDSGKTWNIKNSGTTSNILGISFVDPVNGWVCGESGLIMKTTNGGNSWNVQISNTKIRLTVISFSGINLGIAISLSGIMLRTTNGGTSWEKLDSIVSNPLYDVQFVNDKLGFIVGLSGVLKTIDGGISWSYNQLNDGETFTSLFFINPQKGWITGDWGLIMRTTDSGNSWEKCTNWNVEDVTSIFFIDSTTGWATGHITYGYPGIVLYTNDGGLNWNKIDSTLNDMSWIYFTDKNTGFISSITGNILKTTDSGISWLYCTNTIVENSLTKVFSFDTLNAWVVGGGGHILKTTNGGTNWIKIDPGVELPYHYHLNDINFNDIFFSDRNHGWAVGSGVLFKTTDGGNSWSVRGFDNREIYSIYFRDSLTGWLAGTQINTGPNAPAALIFKTTDGGMNWSEQQFRPYPYQGNMFYQVTFSDENHGWAIHPFAIYNTSDGNSWGWAYQGSYQYYTYILFINKNIGWIGGASGQTTTSYSLFNTIDGGLTWINKGDRLFTTPLKIFFIDSLNGWISGSVIERTTNSGESWLIEDPGTSNQINSMAFPTTTTGWAVGANGTILKYEFSLKEPELISPPDKKNLDTDKVTLIWNKSADTAMYQIQISNKFSFANSEIIKDTIVKYVHLDLNGISKDTAYFWRVRTLTPCDKSSWSEVWKFTTYSGLNVYIGNLFDKFIISPNPANYFINIQFNNYDLSDCLGAKIFDIYGNLLISQNFSELINSKNDLSMNISEFNSGVYFLILSDKLKQNSYKICVIK